MTVNGCRPRFREKIALMSSLVPVAVFAVAISSTLAAQSISAVTASSPAIPGDDKNPVHFKAPTIPAPKAGVPSAYNLCNGQAVPLPANFTDADGLKMDTGLSPCGEHSSSTNQVSGGNPPYHFQWSTGSFPPLGMHLGMNGLLYGTPAPPPLGGYKPFKVCAVDTAANPDCHEVSIATKPAVKAHSNTPLVLGALGAAGVAGVVGARAMSSSSSSGGGSEAGTCSGLAPANACGACSCTDNGTCNNPSSQCGGDVCYWAGPGTAPGQAPFCAK
jgi:hypothetical protein